MFTQVLSQKAQRALAVLGKKKIFRQSIYLAGGTAVALQLGHRFSFDLDFFTPKRFRAKDMAQGLATSLSHFTLEQTSSGTILGKIGDFKFSLFYYQYPLLYPSVPYDHIRIADLRDLVAMKIAAISDRGKKRDFIDLYFILRSNTLTLHEALLLYERKYKKLSQNIFHILKSLTYFDDADRDDMPKMIEKITWKEVKRFFETAVPKTAKLFWSSSKH